MKKTLSFLDRVYRWLCAMGDAAHVVWLFNKFDFFPTEQNLLVSLWYTHSYFRWDSPGCTVYDFLDRRVQLLEENIGNLRRKLRARQLEGRFLQALHNERVRLMVVDFLESKEPGEKYRPVMEAIRSAWRMEGAELGTITIGVATGGSKNGDRMGEAMVPSGGQLRVLGELTETAPQIENGENESRNSTGSTVDGPDSQGIREDELVVGGNGRPLNARTYVIAVQLYFELKGEEAAFEELARRLPELTSFIREHFGGQKLPGRLEEFKGYSYKKGLKERSSAKKGQLRTPFSQIMQHPEIFGEAIALRAQEILKQHFH
jgi:hypothetical protein